MRKSNAELPFPMFAGSRGYAGLRSGDVKRSTYHDHLIDQSVCICLMMMMMMDDNDGQPLD